MFAEVKINQFVYFLEYCWNVFFFVLYSYNIVYHLNEETEFEKRKIKISLNLYLMQIDCRLIF